MSNITREQYERNLVRMKILRAQAVKGSDGYWYVPAWSTGCIKDMVVILQLEDYAAYSVLGNDGKEFCYPASSRVRLTVSRGNNTSAWDTIKILPISHEDKQRLTSMVQALYDEGRDEAR